MTIFVILIAVEVLTDRRLKVEVESVVWRGDCLLVVAFLELFCRVDKREVEEKNDECSQDLDIDRKLRYIFFLA